MSRRIVKWKVVTDEITVLIQADGQDLNLMIDTGAGDTFVLSDQSICDGEPCGKLIYGSYHGKLEPHEGYWTSVVFQDKSRVDMVYHKGTFTLGGDEIPEVDFGIVRHYSTFGLPPHATLGLAPRPEDGDHAPLLDQLLDKGVITRREFSIYFQPENMDEGELIIGGKDTTEYQEPFLQVPLTVGAKTWTIDLKGVEVGGEMSSTSRPILIDSGANSLFGSLKVIAPILKAIQARLKAAGRDLVLNFSPASSHKLQSCSDRVYLPSIKLVLRGKSDTDVNVTVPSELYVLETRGGRSCTLMIKESRGPTAVGLTLLRHYNLHYQWDARQIGIALANPKLIDDRPSAGQRSRSLVLP
ncbi:hypothetical protein FOL47_005769 [Perkinsus chesapeaki]|uniref:Peptidase A1 domain-containing protein n=1 Tax=Perkinsus chesapeaki TaxID=330153 RepID=A0A7J6LWP0_PERCH|nr:hypothetical protein FOL47_005769 [Perkinsus chesapeaki]